LSRNNVDRPNALLEGDWKALKFKESRQYAETLEKLIQMLRIIGIGFVFVEIKDLRFFFLISSRIC